MELRAEEERLACEEAEAEAERLAAEEEEQEEQEDATPGTPGTSLKRRRLTKTWSDAKEPDGRRAPPPQQPEEEDLSALTRNVLKARLVQHKCNIFGSKVQLIARLKAAERSPEGPKAEGAKAAGAKAAVVRAPTKTEPVVRAEEPPASAADEAAFQAELDAWGAPAASRQRLLPLLRRWGPARASQVLRLWSLLGDGASKPPTSATLQVWGSAGTGKTEVTFGYMDALGIRHVRLNCFCFSSVGELHARLAEGLRLAALEALRAEGKEAPKELQQRLPPGKQLRTLDRLEAALRLPLESLGQTQGDLNFDRQGRSVKVHIVLDHAQELQRLGPGVLDLLLSLPMVLQRGEQIAVVAISRLHLSCLGVRSERESPGSIAPAVAFAPYTEAEAEALLLRLLPRRAAASTSPAAAGGAGVAAGAATPGVDMQALCGSGLMKFAVPFLGTDLNRLLHVGEEILRQPSASADPAEQAQSRRRPGGAMASMQEGIDRAVQQLKGLCDLGPLLEPGERSDASAAASVAMRRMTKAEKRLLLAAYLGSRIDKEDDQKLFLPAARRRMKRRPAFKRKFADDEQPVFTRPPRPVPLMRLLAIYHCLARQPDLLGPPLFEKLMSLREAGLLRFLGDRGPGSAPSVERDPKVVCRAELALVRACAGDLNVDLAEYLCSA